MEFGVLGALQVRVRGREVPIRSPRHGKVLAALLIGANRLVPMRQLTEAMWDDDGPATAVRQVQDAISGLRRDLAAAGGPPQLISTQRTGYRLELTPERFDLLAFERERQAALRCASAAETVAGLRRALACWRGPALADLSGRYLRGEAARLDGLRLSAHRRCLELELALGRHCEVADELTTLLKEHPLDEQVAELAMLALYRGGRQSRALEVYRETRDALADAVGVDPAPTLSSLHRRILAADPGLTGPTVGLPAGGAVPRQLPADLADFTGRDRLVERLEELLGGAAAPGGPVVVSALDGAGGMGKTSLAVHVGHRLLGRFPDGQLQADLHGEGASAADPAAVLSRFLRGLGVSEIPAEPEERAALYRSTLAGRRVLVLLDNVRDAAQVRPLLPGGAGCAVLVTSRSVLPGLDGATRVTVEALAEDEALTLFTRIVGTAAVAAEPAAVAAVLGACAGLPLAIRLAAGRVIAEPGRPIAELAERLGDQRYRLGELAVEDRAVRATFAVSYQGRPEEEARAFRLLGLWAGPTIALAAAVALLARTEEETLRLLEALTSAHLLQRLAPGRWRFHDLLRVYAAECALAQEPPAEREAATDRLLGWYLHSCATASRLLNPARRHVELGPAPCEPAAFADYDRALAWCERERANLGAAVAQAVDSGRHELGWKLPIAMWDLFHLRRLPEDEIRCYELALAGARALADPHATAWVLTNLSAAYQAAERLDEAVDCLHEALAIRERLGDERGQASCLLNLGYVQTERGRGAEAVGLLERALAAFHRLDVPAAQAAALVNLGEAHRQLGDLERALDHHRESLTVSQAVGDPFGTSRCLANVADALGLLGRLDEAAEQAEQALVACRATGNRVDEAIALDILGQAHAARDERLAAVQRWQQSHAVLAELGHPRAAQVGARIRNGTGQPML